MSELIKAIEAHLRQLAPHQKERDTATLLRNAVSELSASQARECGKSTLENTMSHEFIAKTAPEQYLLEQIADLRMELDCAKNRVCDEVKQLESKLSASQARDAELQKKLEERTEELLRIAGLNAANVGLLKAAEAATLERNLAVESAELYIERLEARIKASQEQEPVAWISKKSGVMYGYDEGSEAFGDKPLYAQPIIPPELADLQREIETLQSALDAKVTICGDEQIVALKRENAELRKLLEESKVPEELLDACARILRAHQHSSVDWEAMRHLERLLAAAPKEPKQ